MFPEFTQGASRPGVLPENAAGGLEVIQPRPAVLGSSGISAFQWMVLTHKKIYAKLIV